MKFILAGGTLFFILFFANVLMANECHKNALKKAQEAEGTSDGNRGPASTSTSGRVEKGMKDPDGNGISDNQAAIANGRAAAIKAATGKDLTPQQATALLNDANAKNLLGDDYKYYLAEKSNPGKGAAALKAQEVATAAAEARRVALEAAEIKRKADEAAVAATAEKNRLAAVAAERKRQELENYNPYLDPKKAQPSEATVINKSSSELTPGSARQALSAQLKGSAHESKVDPRAYEASSVYYGIRATMDNYARQIRHLDEAIKSNNMDEKLKAPLRTRLQNLKAECRRLSSVITTSGVKGEINDEVASFISSKCN